MQPTRNTPAAVVRTQPAALARKLLIAVSSLSVWGPRARRGAPSLVPGARCGLGENVAAAADASAKLMPTRARSPAPARDDFEGRASHELSGSQPSEEKDIELPLIFISAALCLTAGAMLLYAGHARVALPAFLACSFLAGVAMLRLLPSLRRPVAKRAHRSATTS